MAIDLHVHSTASDGVLRPRDVVRLAWQNGVQTLALTDHDTVAGLDEARREAQGLGMRFVDGSELSVTWSNRTIHVVALAPSNLAMFDAMSRDRSRLREERARAMSEKFEHFGIYGMFEDAMAIAGNALNLSRRHFALALLKRGLVCDENQAFTRYLADQAPCFVPTQWFSLPEVMDFIARAGAEAVLAHPGRYSFDEPSKNRQLLEEFKALGGRVIEVTTGSHFAADNARYTQVAVNMGFWASTGSDFHGHRPGRPAPGLQAPLPTYLPNVLDLLDQKQRRQ